MNLEQLECRLQIHRAFSGSIRSALERLWNRQLTEAEVDVVDSGTMCCSFMRLEALDNKLAHATNASVADGEYGYLKETTSKGRPDVLRAMGQVAAQLGLVLRDPESENLLSVEAQLVVDMRQRQTNR